MVINRYAKIGPEVNIPKLIHEKKIAPYLELDEESVRQQPELEDAFPIVMKTTHLGQKMLDERRKEEAKKILPDDIIYSRISFLDFNALYAHVMRTNKFAISDFRWLNQEELKKITPEYIMELDRDVNAEFGIMAEVTLRYPTRILW